MFVDFIRLSCLTKVIYSSNWECVVKLENPPQKNSCWKPMDSCLWCLPCFGQHTHMLIVLVVVSVLLLPYTWVKNTLPWLIWSKKSLWKTTKLDELLIPIPINIRAKNHTQHININMHVYIYIYVYQYIYIYTCIYIWYICIYLSITLGN